MSFWESMQSLFDGCSIALRDIVSVPGFQVPPLPEEKHQAGKGRFEWINNLPVLFMSGDAAETGKQQGRLLTSHIESFARHYLRSSLGRNRTKWKDLYRWATGCKEFIPERYLEELDAISLETGLRPKTLLGASVFLDFYSSVLCSCIAAGPSRTESGEMVIGRNLDFPTMGAAHRMTLMTVYNPDGYHAFASLTWPGLIGVLTGMNEKGLTVALAEVDGTRPYGRGLPYTLMHRRLLEECGTVSEAEELLRRVTRTRSNNLLVADANDNAAVFEYDRSAVSRRELTRDWVHATNHFVSEGLPSTMFSFKYASAVTRYSLIDRFEQSHSTVTDSQLLQLLVDLAIGRLNLASMLMKPGGRRFAVKIGAPPAARRPVRTFDLKSFLNGFEVRSNDMGRVGRTEN